MLGLVQMFSTYLIAQILLIDLYEKVSKMMLTTFARDTFDPAGGETSEVT